MSEDEIAVIKAQAIEEFLAEAERIFTSVASEAITAAKDQQREYDRATWRAYYEKNRDELIRRSAEYARERGARDPAWKEERHRKQKERIRKTPESYAAYLEYHRNYYAKRKEDPEFVEKVRERNRVGSARRRALHGEEMRARARERSRERYANDPEYRERRKAADKARRAAKKAQQKEENNA